MRLIQLLADGAEGSELDFHPMVTVVSGLSGAAHDRILRALEALPGGRDPGCGGLVEAHGVLLDLSTDTLALLDLSSDLDVVVTASDVVTNGGGESSVLEAETTTSSRLSTERFLERATPGRYPELDQARERQRGAREALDILLDASARSRRERDEAEARRRQAVVALDAATRAAESRERLDHAHDDDDLDDVAGADGSFSTEEIAARRAELEAEIAEHEGEIVRAERGLEELATIDTRPIQVLLEAIRNPAPVEYVPSDRGKELADEFVTLQTKVGELERGLEAEGRGPGTAMQRLEEARAELVAAERAMAKPNLLPEDVAELEAAHEELLEAEKRTSGVRKRGGQKRFEEAQARQQQILDRVGFPTWSAYVMGANLMSIDPLAEQRVERARFDLEAAETNWAQISSLIEADPEHSRLLDELEAVYMEAFDLLGGDDDREDLEAALRNLQEPKREVTTDELVDALSYQLELVGLELGEVAPSIDYTLVVADAFLAEAAEIDERESELRSDIDEASAVVAVARAELDTLPSEELIDLTSAETGGRAGDREHPRGVSIGDSDAGGTGLEELEATVAAASEEVADAAEMLEAREALVDAATQVEAVAQAKLMRVAAELAERESGLLDSIRPSQDSTFEIPGADDDGADEVEFYLLSRLAAQRNVSYAGSVPLVLDDALSAVPDEHVLDLLAKLDRMSDAVQIVMLTSDPTVIGWAEEIGFERAAVVSPPASFG